MSARQELPAGAFVRDLVPRGDDRGVLTELYRADWGSLPVPNQWNLVRSSPNALRGVHIHQEHEDYLIVLEGTMLLGLHDLRKDQPTYGRSALVDLRGEKLQAAFVPIGVLHGFYFAEAATYVYGLTRCWTPADDLGCRWNDPDLELAWPVKKPLLSERDAKAPSLADLKKLLAAQGRAP